MMLKSYLYSDRTQLSAHFNVQEFRCKCGKKHNILISDDLINKLEILFKKLDCSKIIVTSGHRCSDYDKSIGNSGVGQHINGNAADICCYDKNGKPISSKLVCCTAQDVGFGGIANITKAYIYTHVDVRMSNIWYGDEVVNYHTVTNDFYQYFGISKADTTSKADSPKAMKGIDVSRHNGSINWNQVKNDGVQFAILRAGYGKAFYGKFRCPDCGRVFTRHYDPKSGYSYWKCSGAYKKKVMCPNVKAYPDYDLQQICAFLMGDEQFNETKFMETVDHGEILQGDKVQLYFKEGEMKEWRRLQKK